DDLDSSDDESLPDEDVSAEEFKIYSNALFDEDEINSDKLDPHCFNDGNSQQEEIDIVTETEDVLPPKLLIDNSILSHESFDSSFEDNPSIPRPPPEPPDAETDVGEEIQVVMIGKDKFDDDSQIFMFDKVFSLLSAESEDTIFDPVIQLLPTRPRSYDLLYADHLFSDVKLACDNAVVVAKSPRLRCSGFQEPKTTHKQRCCKSKGFGHCHQIYIMFLIDVSK
nr:hypothetical protein [Tanacetum cinerariifolium]